MLRLQKPRLSSTKSLLAKYKVDAPNGYNRTLILDHLATKMSNREKQ